MRGHAADEDAGTSESFPIVALGASAGGLKPLERLLAALPEKPGLAVVVVQHLSPDQSSMLASILGRATSMPVNEVTEGARIERDHVYVIPPDRALGVDDGRLHLIPRASRPFHLVIDGFFESLAQDAGRRVIGVVLSGSGSDGTRGLGVIREEGGVTLAQSPNSAQFDSMPQSAIDAGVVDRQGDPEEIAAEIMSLTRHAALKPSTIAADEAWASDDEHSLGALFDLMRRHAGVDFSGYKRSTVGRRIERRMALKHLDSLSKYADAVKDDPEEAQALAREMLIQVTSFFRNPDAFEALDKDVLRPLIMKKRANGDDGLRVWVPGCSTGEEAYSIGMLLLEALDELGFTVPVKIFGSDVSMAAVDAARLAVYSEDALAGVSSARRDAFFRRVDGGYKVTRRLRDLCVFVKHDITSDPPFTNLDLISCRNLLIYFGVELQGRVVPMLHHSLATSGYLLLGDNESVARFPALFEAVGGQVGLFQKRKDSGRLRYPSAVVKQAWGKATPASPVASPKARTHGLRRQAYHFMLERFSPPGVLVDEKFNVIDFRGRTGPYLQVPPGEPETNLLRLVRASLEPALRQALSKAVNEQRTVRRDGLSVESDACVYEFDLEVIPLTGVDEGAERPLLVLFLEHGSVEWTRPKVVAREGRESDETKRLRSQLSVAQDHLQAVIADSQATADDLAAANEELVAGNEELQSTNEELQSAKEELQSTNEELGTVNDQLTTRNAELDVVASDLVNVLASVEIPVIILDVKLRVRRFTPTVEQVAKLRDTDIGRSINDIKLRVNVSDLSERVQGVMDSLAPREWELRDVDGRWRRLQIRPYRTVDGRLDGVVLSFVDIDALKEALVDAERARDDASRIIEAMPLGLVVLDADLRIVSANRTFYEASHLSRDIEGLTISEVVGGRWDVEPLLKGLREGKSFSDVELDVLRKDDGEHRVMSVSGRNIVWKSGVHTMLLAVEDLTDLRELQKERERLLVAETDARHEAERASQAKDLFLATLSHELRTPLSTLLMQAHLLKRQAADVPAIARASDAINRAAHAQALLVDDLLDVSRIISGKLRLDMGKVDWRDAIDAAVEQMAPQVKHRGLSIDTELGDFDATVHGDAARLQQVVSNLLTNAVKFTPRGGRISVRLKQFKAASKLELIVSDTGIGIDSALIPGLFSTFSQAESSMTRTHGGLGLGLAIVRHIVEAHGGQACGDSEGEGKGASFYIVLPMEKERADQVQAEQPEARDLHGERVLVVEDDEDAREALSAMLEELDLVVESAASASAGLALMDDFKPEIILSDIAMPGEDGYSFIRKVRKRPPEKGGLVPAAALTALATDADRRSALDAGFQMHLPKPLDMDRVAELLRRLVSAKVLAS